MSNRYSSAADAYAPLPRGSQSRMSVQGSAYGDAAPGRSRPTSRTANDAWAPDDDGDDDAEEEWNVYDDFNNTRPLSMTPETAGLRSPEYQQQVSRDISRHSLGGMGRQYSSTSSYGTPYAEQPPAGNRSSLLAASSFGFDVKNGDPRAMEKRLSVNTDLLEKSSKHASFVGGEASQSGIELVTVPALGAEFTEDERRKMTRPYKRRSKRGSKKAKFMNWARGEKKLFGFLDPRMLVFISFIFFILLGLLLFFVIPRQPQFAFNNVDPFDPVPDAGGMSIGNLPLNFTMDMRANLRADNTAGWIPSTLTDISAEVTNVKTYIKVGSGHINELKLPGRQKTVFQFPLHFQYVSLNLTGDATFLDFRNACGAIYPGSQRPTLNLQLSITYNIQGLIGRKGTSAQLADIVCPFQLQNFES